MRVLIVGGGSSLAYALKPVLSGFAEIITAGRSGCDLHLDLNDSIENVELPKAIDAVINTAACSAGDSFEAMYQTESVNVLGTLKLCELCVKAQVKQLVVVSSIFACLDESSHFYSAYSLSKKHADEVAHLYSARFGLPLAVLRPAQFYGVGELYRKNQPFLFDIMDKAENNDDILIHGSNDALRNYIHVEDVANIIARVIQQKVEGMYACLNVENVSYSDVADAAIKAFESTSQVRFIKEKPDIYDNVFDLDDSLYRLIGFYPKMTLSLGMKKEAAYRKANQ